MKKKKKRRNLVAKYAREFVRAISFRDKTKYKRKQKHKEDYSGED